MCACLRGIRVHERLLCVLLNGVESTQQLEETELLTCFKQTKASIFKGIKPEREKMLQGLFRRQLKHERLEEEVEVRFKGKLVSEKELGYTHVRPGGKSSTYLRVLLKIFCYTITNNKHKGVCLRDEMTESSTLGTSERACMCVRLKHLNKSLTINNSIQALFTLEKMLPCHVI